MTASKRRRATPKLTVARVLTFARDLSLEEIEAVQRRGFACDDGKVGRGQCARAKLDNETECRHRCYADTRWTSRR